MFLSFWPCLFGYNKTLQVYVSEQVMAAPHNRIIIGNTVYNTILSLKLSYLHVLANFILWYTCISHIFYKVLQVACTVCICECVFQMHHSMVCPGRGFWTNPRDLTATLGKLYQNFQIQWVYPIPLPGSNHWLVHNSHFDKDYLHMFKSLQQWYLKGKAYYTCKSFVLIEFWLLAGNSSILSTIHQLCFVYFCTLVLKAKQFICLLNIIIIFWPECGEW